MMKTIDQIGELSGKKVFMRADLDVPVVEGKITEPFRIERQKETLRYLLDHGAKVVLAAHISAIPSFEPIKSQLEHLLDVPFGATVTLLENTRQDPGEEKNDETFARTLIAGCDLYVNNAFAVCHREHASVVAVAKLLPAYAGLLIAEEVAQLQKAMDAPAQGKVIVIGGAKASTKVPVIKHLIGRAEHVLVGGVVAIDVLKALGRDIGTSRVDEDAVQLLTGLDLADPRLMVPDDFIWDARAIMDIGPISTERFATMVRAATMVIWNGPMGVFEDTQYATGTSAIAHAAADVQLSVVGGGDTMAAITKAGMTPKRYTFVSTGGGAMLAFLAGQRLPGLEALGHYISS